MSHRLLTSIMSLCLLACAGSTHVRETELVSRPRSTASKDASKSSAANTRKASGPATAKSGAEARDAKTATSAVDEDWPTQSFAGVDTSAPKERDEDQATREVAVKGIEGTTSEYDVRTTLEMRNEDFDRCHDQVGGGSGRIEYRIHIMANGDVGDVKVRKLSVRNRKLVDCYTDVVSSSHFTLPHGGYADVTWKTKVGRSRKRPDAFFERRGRWDTPASGGPAARQAEAESRRERRRGRRDGA